MSHNRMLIFVCSASFMIANVAQAQLFPKIIDTSNIGRAAEIEITELTKDLSYHLCLTADEKFRAEAKLSEIKAEMQQDEARFKNLSNKSSESAFHSKAQMTENAKDYKRLDFRVSHFPICEPPKPPVKSQTPQTAPLVQPDIFKPNRSAN